MAEADSNRSSLYFSEETTWNETPSTPTMNELQRVSDTLTHTHATEVPRTIRSDRLQEDIILVGSEAGGDIAIELRHTQYDNLIAACLGASAFTTATITRTDISAAATDDSYNTVAGDFVAAGFVVGMWVRVAGFTGDVSNNGDFRVTAVTTTKLTISGALVDDAAGESVTISGKMARNGTTQRSFLLEKRFLDITQYQQFTGMRVNSFAMEARNRAIITGTFNFMGAKGLYTGSTVAGSSVAAASNPAMDSTNNIISILEGGSALTTPVFSVSLNLNNNRAVQPAVANAYPIGVRFGTLEVTGSMQVYFQNLTLANKFINHTATSLVIKITDANSKTIFFSIPRLRYTEGGTPVTGENSDIFLTLPFRASYDATTGYAIQFDSLA